MRGPILSAGMGLLVACALPVWAQTTQPDCHAELCNAQATLNQACTCDPNTKSPHGLYVSCVARKLNAMARDGLIDVQCKGKIRSCFAARSTCGKPGFETCFTGRCDTSTGMCTDGTLASGLTTCTSNADCIDGTHCHTMKSFPGNVTPVPGQDQCTLKGGTIGGSNCCASCP